MLTTLVVFLAGFAWVLALSYPLDKQCKKDGLEVKLIQLNKVKKCFIFYERKKGVIARFIFLHTIILYFSLFIFVPIWILFAIFQTYILAIIAYLAASISIILGFTLMGFVTYHVLRAEKAKKQAQPPAKKISTYIPPRAWQTEASEDIVEEEKKKNLWD